MTIGAGVIFYICLNAPNGEDPVVVIGQSKLAVKERLDPLISLATI